MRYQFIDFSIQFYFSTQWFEQNFSVLVCICLCGSVSVAVCLSVGFDPSICLSVYLSICSTVYFTFASVLVFVLRLLFLSEFSVDLDSSLNRICLSFCRRFTFKTIRIWLQVPNVNEFVGTSIHGWNRHSIHEIRNNNFLVLGKF